ncbi:MAG: uroporphyrinogen decarboxylase family protein [Acidobacteria bacterium]|nr:uroporphyrinogen decarboxylase family protein [Acidobacteriota bacterium]
MNAFERFEKRLRGERVDRPPNFDIVMAFAAHYIRRPLSRYYQDHRVLADANLAVIEAFGLDIAQTISDPYREAADWGLDVEFPEDGLPLRTKPLISDQGDLAHLKPPDPRSGARMSGRLEAIRLLSENVRGQIPVMGWVEGALAEANVLRGDTALMTDLYDSPEWVLELLEQCVEVEIEFARAQVEAGADIIGMGDAIASQISPAMYRQFALPYEQRVFAAVHEVGAIGRLHICGNTTHLLVDMARTGADIIDLDWMVDLRSAAHVIGEAGPAVCGNFDPVAVMLRGTPEQVREAVIRSVRDGGPRCFNMPGCEVPDGTPHDNMRAQSRALRELGPG